MSDTDLTVYHDGSCPLCRLEIGSYASQKGAERICFIDMSDPASQPGPDLSRQLALARFHVRLPSGELKSGAAAFIEVWKVIPRWQGPARIAQLPGVMKLLDFGYSLFGPLRPTIARMVGRFSKGRRQTTKVALRNCGEAGSRTSGKPCKARWWRSKGE